MSAGWGGGAAPAPGEVEPWPSFPAPGKEELVERGARLAGLGSGARLLDVGCGTGSSVELLRRSLGMAAVGLDLAPPPRGASPLAPRLRADARCLPLADGAVHGVLLECVLSIVAGRSRVLRECHRVLAAGGRLVLTDLYAREPPAAGGGWGPCGAQLLLREQLVELLGASGFELLCWEDHSRVLKEYLFRRIMDGVGEEVRRPRGCSGARPGYALLVAGRRPAPA